ncbi:hypothetical protein TrVE_jg10505 [Triparma verrucosa]|uniref:Cleft lip and palate associated transmembrane protein n=1 Tax=Triparma verrucosa TaxID=1606542 RepID=A0A9W7FHN4_9STRA|nr:hypothetical protein TrVE_jg10505 [Triparma verrucosa]
MIDPYNRLHVKSPHFHPITAEFKVQGYPHIKTVDLTTTEISQDQAKLMYLSDPLTFRILNPSTPTPWPPPGSSEIKSRMLYGASLYHDTATVRPSYHRQIGPTSTNRTVTINVNVKICSHLEYQLRLYQKQTFDMIDNTLTSALGSSESSIVLDELRYYTSDRYIFRFLLTSLISFAHMYLSFKAFNLEVKYYLKKNRKGVSLSAVKVAVLSELVIFLYLCDGGAGKIVIMSVGGDVCVQVFKFIRLSRFRFFGEWPFVRGEQIEEEKESDDLDGIALKYSTIFLAPFFAGLMMFNYKFYVFKSIYSFVITACADYVYFFGFIKMTPQIYVNYKLKTVSHLTNNMMVYKVFNTFVDDAFAWLVDSPLKWKVMCLRDDLIFAVLVYQKFIYRTDMRRANDFGIAFEEDPKAIEAKEEADEPNKLKNE